MRQLIRMHGTNIMKNLFNSKIIFSCGLIFLSNIGYSQSNFKDMDGNTLKVGDRVEIPEDKGTTFTFKSGDLIDQYLVGERIIIADLKGTVNKLKSDGFIIVKLDRQNVRIFMGSNRKDYMKELGPFEVNMDPQWFRMLLNQQPPSNQNSSQPSDEAIAKVAQNLLMYEKSREIASKVNKQIALSICPNTAKDGVYTILNMEDKGNYAVIDVKNQWTGAACGLCDWETYYTKEKIYITKSNYDIFKIENYYKSDNVSKVWSTSDVIMALGILAGGAAIISSDDDSKNNTSSSSSSPSSTYNSSGTSTYPKNNNSSQTSCNIANFEKSISCVYDYCFSFSIYCSESFTGNGQVSVKLNTDSGIKYGTYDINIMADHRDGNYKYYGTIYYDPKTEYQFITKDGIDKSFERVKNLEDAVSNTLTWFQTQYRLY